MATILNETKSTGGSPYAYYQVNATVSDRTTNSVKVNVQVIGRLSSSNALLGTGASLGLIGYITLYGIEYSIILKGTSDKWSGTTKHTSSREIIVENIPGALEQLTNIKFRVSRTGSAANDYTKGAAMSSKACSNLSIGIGHTLPSNIAYSITEKNEVLINAGVSNTIYVNALSIKEYNISATTYDGATLIEYNVYNGSIPVFRTENPVLIDYSTKELAIWEDTGKVPIRVQVGDNMGGYVSSSIPLNPDLYDYIPYIKISLNETATNVKRVGQTSGRTRLNISGTFYNGIVGNVTQTKPIIKYKFWKFGDIEPETYDNIISNDNIIINNNSFSVTDLEIGSIDETASNYFNPDYAYRVKVYVEDNFTKYISSEKPVPVGEATWTEYKDRVDFKKLTIKGKDVIDDIIYNDNQVLWDPGEGKGYYMLASHTVNLSQKVSEQKSGIVLIWQGYNNGVVQTYDFNFEFIPKSQVVFNPGRGISCLLANSTGSVIGTKYVYVFDDHITGNDANGNGATKRDSGLTTTNNRWVLTKVIGV